MENKKKTLALVESAIMIALATVLSLLKLADLPAGGSVTFASALPIVFISYRHGVKSGLLAGTVYGVLQQLLGLNTLSFVTGFVSVLAVILLDYVVAFAVLGLGGVFREKIKNKTLALVLGVVLTLSLRYFMHILSGFIFYGAWAEWFFSQEGFYTIGGFILDHFKGDALSLVYSAFYNGLFMIPEIIITAIAAAAVSPIPVIKKIKL